LELLYENREKCQSANRVTTGWQDLWHGDAGYSAKRLERLSLWYTCKMIAVRENTRGPRANRAGAGCLREVDVNARRRGF
jgi:hypothetical protein